MTQVKVAIFYTGEMRTINKCFEYFKNNVLINENVHVFATLQTHPYTEKYNQSVLEKNLNEHLKSLKWFRNEDDEEYTSIRDKLINEAFFLYENQIYSFPDQLKDYLKNSGTIAETYQYYLSYLEMKKYENIHNFKYDYIIRIRSDIIITKKIDFSFLDLSNEDILKRLVYIRYLIFESDIMSIKCLKYFMISLIDENRVKANLNDTDCFLNNNNELEKINNIEQLQNYIKYGKYILTIRKNLFFIIKRNLFEPIHDLALKYCKMNDNINGVFDKYFWNGETQFQRILFYNNITQFNSCALLEDKSLYNYDSREYFITEKETETEKEILNEKNNIFLFICRL
jgi:hypothetical protein